MAEMIKKPTANTDMWFFVTLLFLVVDYVRPQDIIPIGFMRPGMLTVLILAYFVITKNGLTLGMSKQSKMMWCFVLVLTILVLFAENQRMAFNTAKTMWLYMPFVLSVIICVNSIKRLKKIVFVYIAVMIYVSIYGILHGGRGSGNYFLDENDISLFINIWLPFCFFLFLYEKEVVKKIFYAAGMLIGIAAEVISLSRGGFVGLLCLTAVIWLFSPRKVISLILLCSIGIGVFIYSGDEYKKEMSTVADTEGGTAKERFLSWEAGWDMFLDNPLGVGGNNFPIHFSEYQSDEFKRGMYGRVAHSLWFTLIPETGIFGVAIFLILLKHNLKDLLFIRKVKANDDPDLRYLHYLSLAFIASLAGFFASATFISVLYYAHYWYLTALIVATVRISKRKLNPTQ